MNNRRKHSKRVFAMLLAIIMCLSQAVTAAADEVSANETVSEESAVPEAASDEEAAKAVPEETVSEEAAPEEPEEAVSGEAAPVEAEPEEAAGDGDYPVSGNFKYEVSGNGEVIIVGLSNDNIESLVIPDYINGKRVTVISSNAFGENFNITSVSLGSHVRTIEDYAFYKCSQLTGNLTIPDSVITIGNYAFCHCDFTGDLTIPNSVETIGDYAFYCCGFTGLTLGDHVKTIGNNAFQDCSSFTGSLTIPGNVVTIGESAFQGCYGFNGNLTIGNKVETIGNNAFYCAGFTGLTLGDHVKTIGNKAFYDCYFTGDLTIPDSVITIGDRAFFNCSRFDGVLLIGGNVKTISNNAFQGCYGFTGSLTIPGSVVTIGKYAFQGCSNLSGNLTIENGVKTIGEYAFQGCSNLSGSLTIPGSVTTIGEYAFLYCEGFDDTLTIPGSVTTIGEYAFDGCINISQIKNGSSVSIPVEWFWNPNEPATICFKDANGNKITNRETGVFTRGFFQRKVDTPPTGVSLNKTNLDLVINESETLSVNVAPETTYYDTVTWNSSNPEVATVSNGEVTARKNGSAVITVTTDSGGYTASCNVVVSDLNYVVSENGEVIITGHKDGTGATGSIEIPDEIGGKPVTVISDNAFKNCSSLTGTLTIPNSVITIGESAFEDCTGFDGALTIGNKVKTISDNAFYNCGFTGDLTIPNSVETIGKGAFSYCSGFTGNLTVGNSVTTIEEAAFYQCSGFTGSLAIGNSVASIGKGVFDFCSGFTGNLTIPDSVKSIGDGAFYQCSGFTGSLTLPNSVTAIGNAAFDKCYDICRIENKSSQKLPVNWFWKDDDTNTVCFVSDNKVKINSRNDTFYKGTYERKVNTLTGVSLNKTSLEVNVGTPETLIATVSPSNTYWDEVSWNSSDKTVATVSNGVVTGLKPGNTVITVTTVSGGLSANCTVTVKNIPVTGVTLNKSSLSMYPGETETLKATVTPAEASQAVKWFSSNEKVATVDNGKVTSISPGSATITVSTDNGGFKATCAVNVYTKATAHKVTFKNEDGSTFATQTVENGKQATDPGSPSKTGYIFIGWSDGTSIWNFTTPVNKDLVLTATYKAEQVVVSENTGSGMDPVPVVSEPEKKGDKTAYKLYLVKGQTFTAGGKGWTTSDKSVATVAAKTGKITGKKTGTAEVANDTTAYTVYVAAPAVSKNSKTVTVLTGQSAEIGIDLQAVDGTADKYPITWYSANPKVAAVNGGMVTGIAKGSAKVTAYIGGKAYSATVKVIDTCKAPSKIKESKAEFSMNPLQSFNVKFDSSVFTVKNATWSGNGLKEVKNGYENNVISITKSGKFTAIGPGTTTVTGTDKNSKTVTVTVTVKPISTKGMVYITKGKTDTIKFPKVTNKKADWWKSSDETVATVDTAKKTGKVTGKSYGSSDISCQYKRFTFSTTAYVEDPELEFGGKAIKNKEKIEMKAGEMKQFKVNNTYQTLNYKSSKPASAFIDENGFVYARKKGKANISTKINGKTYQIAIEVTE